MLAKENIYLLIKNKTSRSGLPMKTFTIEQIMNLAYGASFLGTGGGGQRQSGMKLINEDIDEGRVFKLARLEELREDGLIVSPYYVGAVGRTQGHTSSSDTAYGATKLLKEYLGKELTGIIAAEMGGLATLGALHVAAVEEVPLLDADAAGRAAPDLQCSIFYVTGLGMTPFSVFTGDGDRLLVKSIASEAQAELIVRGISHVTGSSLGICDHPAKVKEIMNSCIRGTISLAMDIGESLRRGNVGELLRNFDVYQIFRGILKTAEHEIREGFTFGTYKLEGTEKFRGKTMKIWFKNENLMSWIDGKVCVTTPDLITITSLDLTPTSNPIREKGKEYLVFGLPSDRKWRTKKGLEVMSPKFFGYDTEFRPIEEVMVK
ncbi:MAG: DUF917 domain-containing protein [Thermoplasmata archaeon]